MWLRLFSFLLTLSPAIAGEVLTGPWRFTTGDNPEYAAPAFDDSGWQQVSVPHRIELQLGQKFSGIAWYRIRVQMPAQQAALSFDGLGHAAEVYIDGRLAFSYGKVAPEPEVIWPVPHYVPFQSAATEAVIAVRVRKVSYPIHGPIFAGLVRPVVLGPADTLKLEHQLLEGKRAAENVLPVTLGIFYLFAGFLLAACGQWTERPAYFLGAGMALGAQGFSWAVGLSPFFWPGLGYTQISVGFALCHWVAVAGFLLVLREWLPLGSVWWWLAHAANTICTAVMLSNVAYLAILILVWMMTCEVGVVVLFLWRIRNPEARLGLAFFVLNAILNLAGNGFVNSFFPQLTLPLNYWQIIPIGRFAVYAPNIWFGGSLLFFGWFVLRSALRARSRQTESEAELRSARAIQESLNRPVDVILPGFALEVCAQAAREVGGDFHQASISHDGALWVVVGDVSGKGLQGALWASTIIGAFREVAVNSATPGEGMRRLNRAVRGLPAGMFISALLVRITPDGLVSFTNAGHILPYANGRMLEGQSGLPLGVFAEAVYGDNRHQLQPGDRLVLLSDGVPEGRDAQGRLIGFETVAQWLTEGILTQDLVKRATAFGQDDDVTVAEVRRVA